MQVLLVFTIAGRHSGAMAPWHYGAIAHYVQLRFHDPDPCRAYVVAYPYWDTDS
jgi:hypothetical protein